MSLCVTLRVLVICKVTERLPSSSVDSDSNETGIARSGSNISLIMAFDIRQVCTWYTVIRSLLGYNSTNGLVPAAKK